MEAQGVSVFILLMSVCLAADPPRLPDPIPPPGSCSDVSDWCSIHAEEWRYLLAVEDYADELELELRAEALRRLAAEKRVEAQMLATVRAENEARQLRRARVANTVKASFIVAGAALVAGSAGYIAGRLGV